MQTYFVGLGNSSRVGKNLLGSILVAEFQKAGFYATTASYAAKVKEVAHVLFGRYGLQVGDYYENHEDERRQKLLNGYTPVELWIAVGNGLRTSACKDVWIPFVMDDLQNVYDVVVVTDVRYSNEVDSIRESGGYLVKVTRPDVVDLATSVDVQLDQWNWFDELVVNDSSVGKLTDWASLHVKKFKNRCG